MSERRPGRRVARIAAIASIAAVVALAAGCSSSGPSHGGGVRIKGGTVTYGNYAPPPTWIWPYEPVTNYDDVQDFLWLLYRPLYMFGDNGSSLNVNYPLSTASAPVYTDGGRTVTINLKGWKWSDGETVDASDVMFWLNMMKAEPDAYAGYVPGLLPDNLVSFKATGPLQVTLRLNQPYSSLWFTYNQLAEITPMPAAWDVTSMGAQPGSGGCATDTAADKYARCKAVYKFLVAQATNTATYVSSPIWSVVDGPWRLSSFSSSGDDSFVPNPKYSGSPKPTISVFKEVTYTSSAAEYVGLKTGQLDIGYIPPADLPQKPAGSAVPSADPLGSGFTLAPFYEDGIVYVQPNFNNPVLGWVFRQLYVRQAIQETVDQPGIDATTFRGYSVPTSGGVPTQPPSQWIPATQLANRGQGPYAFSIAKAKATFASHGWKIIGGVQTCENPGTGADQCGAHIARGQQMKFTLDWGIGIINSSEVAIWKSDASQAGIDINLVGQSSSTVIGEATPCKMGPACTAQALEYGGWEFDGPGFEPTGEPLFATGAASNSGSYSSPVMDNLIQQTHTSSSLAVFHTYATYTAEQLPYIWQPAPYYVYATNSKLHDVAYNAIGTLLPEYWYFTR
jgi:peptide/nickel transport system substrate-binding protein